MESILDLSPGVSDLANVELLVPFLNGYSSLMRILALQIVLLSLLPAIASAQSFGSANWQQQTLNGQCHQQGCNCCPKPRKSCRIPGLKGYPYQDPVHNGCLCNHPCRKKKCFRINPHWPSPFANMENYTAPNCPPGKKLRDVFDVLANVKLVPYKRKDSGYRGYYCDPFGKLGESQRGIVYKKQPQQSQPQNFGPAPGVPTKNKDSVAQRYRQLPPIR